MVGRHRLQRRDVAGRRRAAAGAPASPAPAHGALLALVARVEQDRAAGREIAVDPLDRLRRRRRLALDHRPVEQREEDQLVGSMSTAIGSPLSTAVRRFSIVSEAGEAGARARRRPRHRRSGHRRGEIRWSPGWRSRRRRRRAPCGSAEQRQRQQRAAPAAARRAAEAAAAAGRAAHRRSGDRPARAPSAAAEQPRPEVDLAPRSIGLARRPPGGSSPISGASVLTAPAPG